MIFDLHFLRPWWFIAWIPLAVLLIRVWNQPVRPHAWSKVCDPHLLEKLFDEKHNRSRVRSLSWVVVSLFFMILSLSGPTWFKFPVPTFQSIIPRVLVLDMSEGMLKNDISPDRLSRAKFNLQDLLTRKNVGQFGMVVYTGEPFVVSPLTDDGQTIVALLPSLTADVIPVGGNNLSSALMEASHLIEQADYQQGELLVITATPPGEQAMNTAEALSSKGIRSSIMPMRPEHDLNPLFKQFAVLGQGELLPYTADSKTVNKWVQRGMNDNLVKRGAYDDVPLWRDEGRWFLIPALLFLVPLFRRGWLQRVEL